MDNGERFQKVERQRFGRARPPDFRNGLRLKKFKLNPKMKIEETISSALESARQTLFKLNALCTEIQNDKRPEGRSVESWMAWRDARKMRDKEQEVVTMLEEIL